MHYLSNGKEFTETYTTDGKERMTNENQGGKVFVRLNGRDRS
jgi:hypothetical protein